MGKYLDPRADLTFKKVFGEHKNLVISLLNAMLPLKDDERVESIEYWPAEKVPKRTQVEKDSIVDVCCKDNKHREFIVEMQMSWTESFKKRVLLNASKAYVAQSESGEDYDTLQPVYALNFVNENFQKDMDDYYHYYHLVHDQHTDKVIDGFHLVFVELKKFKPHSFSEKKMQVLWLRFLTEINAKTLEAPVELLENPEVSEALKIVEIAAYTPAEMRAYDKFWDNVSVQKTLDNARKREIEAFKRELEQVKQALTETKAKVQEAKAKEQEAKAKEQEAKAKEQEAKAKEQEAKAKEQEAKAKEQEAKAKEQEAKDKLMQTARNLKAMNIMTVEQIAKATGLTVEVIDDLQTN